MTVTASGAADVTDDRIAAAVDQVWAERGAS
jgi:hypothetical protein